MLEVRNTGKKHKDLVEGGHYARLRIPEYFSFDCRSGVLRGWRLPSPRARSYQPVMPQGGYLASGVGPRPRGDRRTPALLREPGDRADHQLVARLQAMADRNQQVAAESQKVAVESQKAAEVSDRAARSLAALGAAVLRLCERQGVALSDRQRARVVAEPDPERLALWLERCVGATAADDVFADG